MSELRSPRRRRSVAVAPALLDPAELPEDAPGRVKLITVEAPADIVDAAGTGPSDDWRAPRRCSRPAAGGSRSRVAGAVIVVIFVVGMLLTHS